MSEYIEREAFLKAIEERYCLPCKEAGKDHNGCKCDVCWVDDMSGEVIDEPAADVEKMSDGYHTFADLYEQRLILSAALSKNNPHAWKSKRHEDGSVPFGGGWFIMGFDTDEGCYTYHYELKDWDLFQCEELGKGKPWDGHTSKDVRRLLSIPAADVAPVVHGRWIIKHKHRGGFHRYTGIDDMGEQHTITVDERIEYDDRYCSECGKQSADNFLTYCPNCGARMDGDDDAKDIHPVPKGGSTKW